MTPLRVSSHHLRRAINTFLFAVVIAALAGWTSPRTAPKRPSRRRPRRPPRPVYFPTARLAVAQPSDAGMDRPGWRSGPVAMANENPHRRIWRLTWPRHSARASPRHANRSREGTWAPTASSCTALHCRRVGRYVPRRHDVQRDEDVLVTSSAWRGRRAHPERLDLARDYMPSPATSKSQRHHHVEHLLRQTSDWQGTLWASRLG